MVIVPGAPIPIDNQVTVTQLRAQWTVPSFGEGESSWSFIQPAANSEYLETVLDLWIDNLAVLFAAARPVGWFMHRVVVEDRWPQVRGSIVDATGWGPNPETLEQGLPPQCTPVISWRTGLPSRSNRGRTYWGPCRRTDAAYDNVLDDTEDAVHAFATEMIHRFTGATFPSNPKFSIVSRVHNGEPIIPIGNYLPVIEYFFAARYGVQRRRTGWDWRY